MNRKIKIIALAFFMLFGTTTLVSCNGNEEQSGEEHEHHDHGDEEHEHEH